MRGFATVVATLGGDPTAFAERYHVPLEALANDDVFVADVAMARLLEGAARELPCPDLGLRMIEYQDISILGPLAVAIQNSATVGDALSCVSRFLFVHSPVLSFSVGADPERRPGTVGLFYGSSDGGPPPTRQGADLGLGMVHRVVEFLVGGRYGLQSVHLPHRPLAPLARYAEFYGAEVLIDQPAALLRVPQSLLAIPLTGVDETLREIAMDYLTTRFAEPGNTIAPRVRLAVERSLGSVPPRIGSAARLLRMHPRTVQRRLAEEQTSFAAIVDDVRKESARRLLTRTDIPLTQAAALLGLAEQSVLTRCSRRWFGATPSEVRKLAQGS
ncbi:MAG: AraC family transcriptional regulator [Actinomycetales bacterium]